MTDTQSDALTVDEIEECGEWLYRWLNNNCTNEEFDQIEGKFHRLCAAARAWVEHQAKQSQKPTLKELTESHLRAQAALAHRVLGDPRVSVTSAPQPEPHKPDPPDEAVECSGEVVSHVGRASPHSPVSPAGEAEREEPPLPLLSEDLMSIVSPAGDDDELESGTLLTKAIEEVLAEDGPAGEAEREDADLFKCPKCGEWSMEDEIERPASPARTEGVSPSDPFVILAGIKQFGLATDGSDLRDLHSALAASHQQLDEATDNVMVCLERERKLRDELAASQAEIERLNKKLDAEIGIAEVENRAHLNTIAALRSELADMQDKAARGSRLIEANTALRADNDRLRALLDKQIY